MASTTIRTFSAPLTKGCATKSETSKRTSRSRASVVKPATISSRNFRRRPRHRTGAARGIPRIEMAAASDTAAVTQNTAVGLARPSRMPARAGPISVAAASTVLPTRLEAVSSSGVWASVGSRAPWNARNGADTIARATASA